MSSARVSDRYTLDRQIGRGGSGVVWVGRDEILGRTVALKRIGFPPGSVDADVIRAEREARLAARVNHPNVVAVYDHVEGADEHWLVMEYVEGTTLASLISERGRLAPDHAAPLLAQVAEALVAAHAAGIVHRDVKPSNILIGGDNEVKLTDFGIARGIADVSLTQTGLVTGSPAYLSPEVASGRSATQASDVWSLGATLFHALAGTPPYDVGDNVMGAMYRIVHDDPPRLRTAGWLGPLLEATMTKDPAARPTMADVRDYLTGLAPAAEPTARQTQVIALDEPQRVPAPEPMPTKHLTSPPNGDRRAGVIAGVGGALVALLVLVGVVLMSGQGDEDPETVADGRSSSPSQPDDSTDPSSTDPTTDDEAPARPTAEDLEQFAEQYVATASSDPEAGFAMLTSTYQRRSPEYVDFWSDMHNPKILEVRGDPDSMQVVYVYRYQLKGEGKRTERITLSLVQRGDQLLIAGASASPV